MILQNKPRFLQEKPRNPDETKKPRSSGEKPSRGNSVQMSEESTAVPYRANFYLVTFYLSSNSDIVQETQLATVSFSPNVKFFFD